MRRLLLVLPFVGMAVLNAGCTLDKNSRDLNDRAKQNQSENPGENWETPFSSLFYQKTAQWFSDEGQKPAPDHVRAQ